MDYTLSPIDATRRSRAALSYSMLLTHVFTRVQLLINRHSKDGKHPATTIKAIGLKPQGPKKEEKKKEKKKREKKKDPRKKDTSSQKIRSKPSEEKR